MNQTTQDVLDLRHLRSQLTNQLCQAMGQHKGCVLELRETDSSNTEIRDFLKEGIKMATGVIIIIKKELSRVDQMISAVIKEGRTDESS